MSKIISSITFLVFAIIIFYVKKIDINASSSIRYLAMISISLFFLSLYYSYKENKKPNCQKKIKLLMQYFFLAAIICIAINTIFIEFFSAEFSIEHLNWNLAFYASATSLFFSTSEEIVFRGLIYSFLIKIFNKIDIKSNFIVAILVAVLFSVYHIRHGRPIEYYVYVFFMGLLLSELTTRYQSLWPSIGLHWGIDFIADINAGAHSAGFVHMRGLLNLMGSSSSSYFLFYLTVSIFGLFSLKKNFTSASRSDPHENCNSK